MISSSSSFEIISAVVSDQKMLILMVADTAVVNPNGINMLLVNVVSTFFINGQTADKI